MIVFDWFIYSLVVWRIASLISHEEGPFDIFSRVRYKAGVRYDEKSNEFGKNNLSRGILCLWCTSVWVALPVSAVWEISHSFSIVGLFMVWMALSSSAILFDEIVNALKK